MGKDDLRFWDVDVGRSWGLFSGICATPRQRSRGSWVWDGLRSD